jgi:hypothetical protein
MTTTHVDAKKPRSLCFEDAPTTVMAWACGSCATVYPMRSYPNAYEIARTCCNPVCTKCDGETAQGNALCAACRKNAEATKEAVRFERARKIPLDDYQGDYLNFEDATFDVDALDDAQSDRVKRNEEPMTYAWACAPEEASFDVVSSVADMLEEEHPQGSDADVDYNLLDAAQILVDKAIDKVVSHRSRSDIAVLLPPFEAGAPSAGHDAAGGSGT